MTDTDPANRTRYMARALGLFLLVFGIDVAMRATTLYLLIPAFFQDGALVFVTAAFGMAIGAAMVAAHNRWNNLPAIIVSLFRLGDLHPQRHPSDRAGLRRRHRRQRRTHANFAGDRRPRGRAHRRLPHLRRLVCQARRLSLHHRSFPGGRVLDAAEIGLMS
jgi:hypothetical protein